VDLGDHTINEEQWLMPTLHEDLMGMDGWQRFPKLTTNHIHYSETMEVRARTRQLRFERGMNYAITMDFDIHSLSFSALRVDGCWVGKGSETQAVLGQRQRLHKSIYHGEGKGLSQTRWQRSWAPTSPFLEWARRRTI